MNVFLCIVYLPGSTCTSVEKLIVINYLWDLHLAKSGRFEGVLSGITYADMLHMHEKWMRIRRGPGPIMHFNKLIW